MTEAEIEAWIEHGSWLFSRDEITEDELDRHVRTLMAEYESPNFGKSTLSRQMVSSFDPATREKFGL